MACFIEVLKCILCCEEEHVGDRYQDSHTNHSYIRIPTSTLARARRQFEEDVQIKIVIDQANNWNPALFNASVLKGSSYVRNSLPLKLPAVTPTPKPILLPPPPSPSIVQHKNSEGITNKSLPVKPLGVTPKPILLPTPIPSIIQRKYAEGITNKSLPVKPLGVTPKPILLLSTAIPSIIQHKNAEGITNKSLVTIDPLLPSSSGLPLPTPRSPYPSHVSNPPKETKYVWIQKGATPTYEVPEDFKALIKKDIIPGVLKKPLSPLTYRDYFAALLYAEDYYTEKWSDYLLSDVTLELHKAVIYEKVSKSKKPIKHDKMEEKYFVAFEIDKVPERRPFLLSRDFVLAKPAGKNVKPFKGSLYRVVKRNLVLAEFGVDFHSRHSPKLKYDVSFSFNRVCLKRSHQAVEAAMDPLFQDFLFPNLASRIRELDPPYHISSHRNFDHVQSSTIYRISRIQNPPPYLIEGPLCVTVEKKLSRTGIIIQQAVLQICKMSPGCRILINAPTNSTCDVLMRGLKEEIPESDMFRANAAFREIDGVPCDILPLCTFEEGCFTCPSLQELKSFKVILSTFVSSFRLHNEGISGGHFSHIFLVDASSATEPEIMISLANLADPKTVVVVSGASTNSPTRVRSDIARRNGLWFSYFERLFVSEPYRSHDPMFVTCIDKIG